MRKVSTLIFLLLIALLSKAQTYNWTYFGNTEFSNFVVADSESVWLGSNGLVKMLKADNSLIYYNTSNSPIFSNNIAALTICNNNNIWILLYNYASWVMQRFDGAVWTTYENFPEQLNYASIESFVADAQENIWIRGNGLLFKFDGINWNQVLLPGYDSPNITALSSTADGSIYASGYYWNNSDQEQFISKYDGANWQNIVTVPYSTIGNESIKSICVDSEGILYAATGNDIYSYNGNTFKNLHYPSDFDYINKIICGKNSYKEFTVLTYGAAVSYSAHEFAKLSSVIPLFESHYANDLFIEANGTEWFASDSLIFGSGLSWTITPTYSSFWQLGRSLFVDSSNELVFLTQYNLFRSNGNLCSPVFPFTSNPDYLSLAAYDSKMNTWYAMSASEKFYKYHIGDVSYTTYNSKPDLSEFDYSYITRIAIDKKSQLIEKISYGSDGAVMKGESYEGLFVDSDNVWKMVMGDGVEQFVVDSQNVYWIFSESGLKKYDGVSLTDVDLSSLDLTSVDLKYLSIDRHNTIWLNTTKGLFNNSTGVFGKYEVDYPTQLGNLFFDQNDYAYSGSDSGLQIMKVDSVSKVSQSNSNIPSDWISNPVVDNYSNIWVLSYGSVAVCYGCAGITIPDSVIPPHPDIKNEPKENVTFFPNPVSEQFNFQIEAEQQSYLTISVNDVLGRSTLLLSDWIEKGTNRFSFSADAMSNGIYFYKISIDKKDVFGKFIVSK